MGFFSNIFKKSSFYESEYTVKDIMPIAQVIGAHANWKARMNKFMEGTLGYQLDPEVLSQSNETELGRWILQADEEEKSGEKRELLKQIHDANAELHAVASEIASAIQGGRQQDISKLNDRFQEIAKNLLLKLLDYSKR